MNKVPIAVDALNSKWVASLPLILCGPILRKVHYNHVSVWIAFKEPVSDITLYVFEASDPLSMAAKSLRLTGTQSAPLKIGNHLFVTLVTATHPAVSLKAGVIYGYKILFKQNGVQKQLGNADVLKGGIRSIAYLPYTYPTFCLPADQLSNLKLVHGSCRKPHGGKTDALRALDTMLEINCRDAKERPQLLCLTGDQIYADDVSDMLLYRLMKAQHILLGWKETLPGQPGKYKPSQLQPGNRKVLIAKTGNKATRLRRLFPFANATSPITPDDLTTTDAKSHLIFFGEFLLMYLFTFSDSLLTAAGWPQFEDVYKQKFTQSQKQERLLAYKKEINSLNNFIRCLPFVKKALANISTLMIFDDHDVTDDWFITKEWSVAALTPGTLSRRYMLNGMLAYALFQDWGNDHLKYTSGHGLTILHALQLNNTQGHPNKYTRMLDDILLPKLIRNAGRNSYSLQAAFKWDYQVEYKTFNLWVLNIRTEREYYDKEGGVASLIKDLPAVQGSRDASKLQVFVSPAPVFGNIPLETRQEQFRKGTTDLLTAALSRGTDNIGLYERDQEAWAFSGRGFKRLLLKFSDFKKVLILSGDVHYAYTAYIRLFRKLGNDPYKLTEIVQSTASALKNSTEKTHYPAINKFSLTPRTDFTYKMAVVKGKTRPGGKFEGRDNPTFQDPEEYNPARTRVEIESVTPDSLLQYTVRFIKSNHQQQAAALFNKIKSSAQARSFNNTTVDSRLPLTVVGKDNIAAISFKDNSITSTIWFANGNFVAPDDKESFRLTFPFVAHNVVFNNRINEAELPIALFDKMKGQKVWR